MKADAVPLLDLFEKKMRLEVPLFQRQYVWTLEQQWEPLWEDVSRKFAEFIEGRPDGPVHFLGAIVSGGEKIGHKGRCSAVLWQSKTRPAAGVPQNSPGVFCGMWEGCIPWSCTGVSGGRFLSKGSAGGRRRDDSV